MNEFETYKFYNALNLHYKSDNYDFFKVGVNHKTLTSTYLKKPEYIRRLFKSISELREPKLFIAGNIIFNPSKYIGDFDNEYYFKFRKIKINRDYIFSEDIKKIDFSLMGSRYILGLFLNDEISLMTICILDKIFDILKPDSITKNTIKYIRKSQGFFNFERDYILKILYNNDRMRS